MIKLKLMRIENLATNWKLYLRITCDPYVIESKRINGYKTEAIKSKKDRGEYNNEVFVHNIN